MALKVLATCQGEAISDTMAFSSIFNKFPLLDFFLLYRDIRHEYSQHTVLYSSSMRPVRKNSAQSSGARSAEADWFAGMRFYTENATDLDCNASQMIDRSTAVRLAEFKA